MKDIPSKGGSSSSGIDGSIGWRGGGFFLKDSELRIMVKMYWGKDS